MDLEKAVKAAELVNNRNIISSMMQTIMVDLKKAGTNTDATTTITIYSRWLPALAERAADDLGELDRKIKEL